MAALRPNSELRTLPPMPRTLKLGTRGSRLALWQANWIRDRLLAEHSALEVNVVVIRTRAEKFPERDLKAMGVGVFTRELDDALLAGEIDLAVHSLKDVPSELPRGVAIASIPRRESPLDAFVSAGGTPLAELPPGARIGTGSPRRKAQLLAYRSDLDVVPLRGNVDTRLRKLGEESLAGTVLAHAGLRRLGREEVITEIIEPRIVLPAVGQGAVAVCASQNDASIASLLASLDDPPTHVAVSCERALLRTLRGGCQIPAGALAVIEGPVDEKRSTVHMDAVLASPDGATCLRGSRSGPASRAESVGQELAEELLRRGGDEIVARLREGEH